MLPNFLCIGAQKAGTTSLYNQLKQHPDIYLSEKELHFFNKKIEFDRGISYYEQYFNGHSDQKVIGEFTPDYSVYSFCPKRIKDTIGADVKILFLIRQPVMRAYSQYNHYRVLNAEGASSFEDVLQLNDREIQANEYNSWDDPKYYVGRGLYYEQLKRYIDMFGKQNILTIRFEDLISKNKDQLDRIYNFLGVDKHFKYTFENNNQTQIPKNKFTNKLLYLSRRSFSKKLINSIKFIIPESLFQKIKKKFFSKTISLPEKLENQKVIELTQKYFIQDIKKLEVLIDEDLSSWYRINN